VQLIWNSWLTNTGIAWLVELYIMPKTKVHEQAKVIFGCSWNVRKFIERYKERSCKTRISFPWYHLCNQAENPKLQPPGTAINKSPFTLIRKGWHLTESTSLPNAAYLLFCLQQHPCSSVQRWIPSLLSTLNILANSPAAQIKLTVSSCFPQRNWTESLDRQQSVCHCPATCSLFEGQLHPSGHEAP
jgi:hypothetical protein